MQWILERFGGAGAARLHSLLGCIALSPAGEALHVNGDALLPERRPRIAIEATG